MFVHKTEREQFLLKVFVFTPNLVVFCSAYSCISPLPLDIGGLTTKQMSFAQAFFFFFFCQDPNDGDANEWVTCGKQSKINKDKYK